MNKILVVNDRPDIIDSIRVILDRPGYFILSAPTSYDALKIIETEKPDIILLDLPGKTGLEVCKILKSQPGYKNIPIIIFTASDEEFDRKLASWAGADACFKKPVTGDLLAEVDSCLEKAKSSKFSKLLGMEHNNLTGRKILLEFDPRSDFEKGIEDFVIECSFHGEVVFVVTSKGSTLRQTLGADKVTFIDLNPANLTIFPPLLNEHPHGPVSIVFDNLTTLAILGESAYNTFKFAQNALQVLADRRVTAIFLLNLLAHQPRSVASLRGIFANQLVYDERGLSIQRFAN